MISDHGCTHIIPMVQQHRKLIVFKSVIRLTAIAIETFYCFLSFINPQQYTQTYDKY